MRAAARPPLPLFPRPATTRIGPSPPTRRTSSARFRPVCSMSARSARAYLPVASIISCCVCAAVTSGSSLHLMVGNVTCIPPAPGSDRGFFTEARRAVNVLDVIKLLERVEDADDFFTVSRIKFDGSLRKLRQLADRRLPAFLLDALKHAVQLCRLRVDGQAVLVDLEVKRPEFDDQLLHVFTRIGKDDHAPGIKLPGGGAGHVAAVLAEHVPHLRGRAVAVVRQGFNDDGDARGAVALVDDFLEIPAFGSAGGAFDCTLDDICGNVIRPRCGNRVAQGDVRVGIPAAASAHGSLDGPDVLADDFSACGVVSRFFPFNLRPLVVTCQVILLPVTGSYRWSHCTAWASPG